MNYWILIHSSDIVLLYGNIREKLNFQRFFFTGVVAPLTRSLTRASGSNASRQASKRTHKRISRIGTTRNDALLRHRPLYAHEGNAVRWCTETLRTPAKRESRLNRAQIFLAPHDIAISAQAHERYCSLKRFRSKEIHSLSALIAE